MQDEQVAQRIDDVAGVQLAIHADCQTFSAVFVDDVERAERLSVISPAMHEVVRPNMTTVFWP